MVAALSASFPANDEVPALHRLFGLLHESSGGVVLRPAVGVQRGVIDLLQVTTGARSAASRIDASVLAATPGAGFSVRAGGAAAGRSGSDRAGSDFGCSGRAAGGRAGGRAGGVGSAASAGPGSSGRRTGSLA